MTKICAMPRLSIKYACKNKNLLLILLRYRNKIFSPNIVPNNFIT
jgi:hypothetical protein